MKPSIFENEIKIQKRIAAAFEEDGEGKAWRSISAST